MPEQDNPYLQYMNQHREELTGIRQDIHQHPELGFEEHRTSDLVARQLKEWGYEVTTGLGGTGVVGQLVRGDGGKRLGLRADMDALPITETTGLPYASTNPGVMHACGHDGHTAMLLAAARYLAHNGAFNGTLNLIFQPAEEGLGGALKMLEDGLFEQFPCDAIYACHNGPGIAVGDFHFREGPLMASSDFVTIHLTGVGGHGAHPHNTNDPIVAASAIVMALQTIVSRNIDPLKMAVVTVGAIHSGVANNVIPAHATLELTVRTLDPRVRKKVEDRLKAIVHGQAESFGVTADIDYRPVFSVLVNSAEETAFARSVAERLFGKERVNGNTSQRSGSEDFAFMLEKCPGSYFLVGNGAGPGTCMVHNPGYDFNDATLPIGAAYWAALTEAYLR